MNRDRLRDGEMAEDKVTITLPRKTYDFIRLIVRKELEERGYEVRDSTRTKAV